VQAGAFSSQENAARLRDRLAPRYPSPWVEDFKGLKRVKFGPYASRAEAEAARDSLEEMGLAGILVGTR
jgi:cell division protein FtsN